MTPEVGQPPPLVGGAPLTSYYTRPRCPTPDAQTRKVKEGMVGGAPLISTFARPRWKKIAVFSSGAAFWISGQKAISTISKKDVAAFKLRKGMPIGAKVTLRGERMYEFLDRLVTAALPRVRDFQGVKANGFDGRGNYNLGITEQIIFPEIDIDKVNKISGMDISFVTSARTDKEAKSLLSELGLPFKKN